MDMGIDFDEASAQIKSVCMAACLRIVVFIFIHPENGVHAP
jgi:hypothetical protein